MNKNFNVLIVHVYRMTICNYRLPRVKYKKGLGIKDLLWLIYAISREHFMKI